jgi:hypothetical protein
MSDYRDPDQMRRALEGVDLDCLNPEFIRMFTEELNGQMRILAALIRQFVLNRVRNQIAALIVHDNVTRVRMTTALAETEIKLRETRDILVRFAGVAAILRRLMDIADYNVPIFSMDSMPDHVVFTAYANELEDHVNALNRCVADHRSQEEFAELAERARDAAVRQFM